MPVICNQGTDSYQCTYIFRLFSATYQKLIVLKNFFVDKLPAIFNDVTHIFLFIALLHF